MCDFSRKGQNIWKFVQKCTKFENILKKGSLMHVTIACMKHLEYALHKVVFWQTCIQEIVQIAVKCCLNCLRKKYRVLNNNFKKMFSWREHVQSGLMQFLKLCLNLCSLRWLNPNLNLVSNFRPRMMNFVD